MRSLKALILYAPLVTVLASIAPKPASAAGPTYLPAIGCTGYVHGNSVSTPVTCPPTIPGSDLSPGAAAANLGNNQVSPTDSRYGAKCDGVTDDTLAFISAIAANSLIVLPPQKTCIVNSTVASNIVITDNKTLDCNGSILKPTLAGDVWTVKKTGFNSTVRHCVFYDPGLVQMQTTTLTADATPGATVLSVANAAAFQVNMVITVQLVSGAYWVSKITAVGAGSVTIADAIPSTVSVTPTVATGGTGYADQTECTVATGAGPPLTGTISVTTGAITAFAPNSPGLYQTPPSSPAAVVCPATLAASSGSVNLTFAGATSGAFVDASFGAYYVDHATGGFSEDLNISEAPVGVQVTASTGTTSQETFNNINVYDAPMVGFAKFINVNNLSIKGVRVNGFAHHASAYGTAGLYIDGENQTAASGGNHYEVLTLGFENGVVDLNGTLDLFDYITTDTTRNYGFACIKCNNSTFSTLRTTFSGPNALSAVGGKGVGFYIGGLALSNSIGTFTSQYNMTDIHFGDQISTLWMNNLSWSASKIMTGFTNSLYPGFSLFIIPTISISTLASPVYMAPGLASTTQTVSLISGTRGIITSAWASTGIPPQSATYKAFLYLNRWSQFTTVTAATVAAGGASGTPGACVATVVGGTGTAATVSGTVTGGGALAGALTVTPGSYTAPPSSPASITGCGLTGATVNLTTTNYGGWAAYGGCQWTGAIPGCLYTGPGIPIFPQDQIELVIAIIGGGSFPSNQTFNGYVDGM